MIINTNGFEIGDEVWVVDFETLFKQRPKLFKIKAFLITELGVMAKETYSGWNEGCMISCLYHTQQECQLACDKLNLKTEI